MARPKSLAPKMYYLRSAGAYCVNLAGRRVKLGTDPEKAQQKYRRVLAEYLVTGTATPRAQPLGGQTVAEALLAYCRHRRDVPPRTMHRLQTAATAACELYGHEPTGAFDQIALQAVRCHLLQRPSKSAPGGRSGRLIHEALADGPIPSVDLDRQLAAAGLCYSAVRKARKRCCVLRYYDTERSVWMASLQGSPARAGKPLSRTYVNHLIGVLQTAWDWLVSQKMAPDGSAHALRSVKPLGEGEGGRETPAVLPVPPEWVDRTLPECNRVVAAMVRLQRLTGMRPGEVCALRPCDLSRSAAQPVMVPVRGGRLVPVSARETGGVLVWAYAPVTHKNRKRGKPRVVAIGPEAQAVLVPFLEGRSPEAPLFSALEASDEARVQERRRKRYGRQPGAYTPGSYAGHVEAAARRAGVPHWSPHRLRHAAATLCANLADQHVAQAVLGHASPDMTARYVEGLFLTAAGFAARHG